MDNLAGKQLGQYEVIQEFARGGMATVYTARQTSMDRQVAIKVLPPQFTHDPQFIKRFEREVALIAALEHPHILPVYDYGEADGMAYIVMRLMTGGTLQDATKNDLLPLDRISTMLSQVASAMDYAHSRGVIHRDLKPSNILLDSQGNAYVADFGIAHLTFDSQSLTGTGMAIGTPAYMSPEQAQGQNIDARTDIYAMGIILYELLTGKIPFQGDTPMALILKHMSEPLPSPRASRPDLPAAIEQVVIRATAKKPDDRYDSMTALNQAFTAALITPDSAPAAESPSVYDGTVMASMIPSQIELDRGLADSATMVDVSPDATGIMHAEQLMPDVQLAVVKSTDAHLDGSTFKLKEATFTIGRANAELNISDDKGISRQHARITFENGSFFLKDLNSSNGTYLNGKRIQADEPVEILFGSWITVGQTTLRFMQEKLPDIPDLEGLDLGDNRYRIDELLKKSRKGAVYRGFDRALNRDVAIKILSPDLVAHPNYRTQFYHGAKTAAALAHPHIINIHDYGTDGDLNYIVMDLLAGGSLEKRLYNEDLPALTLDEIAAILEQLGDALDYAHRNGVLHSGLKPNTVIFDSEGQIFLSDFAVSRRLGDPDDMTIIGAPAFIAPEQWNQEQLSGATDQYALAVLAYLMVSGAHPFNGQYPMDYRNAHLTSVPLPVHVNAAKHDRPNVPEALSEILDRALSKHPADRYATVSDFAAGFAAAAAGQIIQDTDRNPRIFISYRRSPSAMLANYIALRLQEHEIDTYVDTRKLDGGDPFPDRLLHAIDDADVFVCLLADSTFASEWVRREITYANAQGKPLIPVFQESYEGTEDLSDDHIVALLKHDGIHILDVKNIYIDEAISNLAKMVQETVKPT
jgi:serine/threonine protein kinase